MMKRTLLCTLLSALIISATPVYAGTTRTAGNAGARGTSATTATAGARGTSATTATAGARGTSATTATAGNAGTQGTSVTTATAGTTRTAAATGTAVSTTPASATGTTGFTDSSFNWEEGLPWVSEGTETPITAALVKNGRGWNVNVTNAEVGSSYTLLVLSGEYAAFPELSASAFNEKTLYIDMKKAEAASFSFSFIPKNNSRATVFISEAGASTESSGSSSATSTGKAMTLVGQIGEGEAPSEEPVCYTISFDAGGGKGTMESKSVEIGTLFTLPKCGFIASKLDEVFTGWDIGDPGDTIKVIKDVKLTATWGIAEKQPEEEEETEEEEYDETGFVAEFVNPSAVYVYTSLPIEPAVKVTYNGKRLEEGLDYTVSYSNNINASQGKAASVNVKGIGNFNGNQSLDFLIKPKSIQEGDTEGGTVPVECPDKVYEIKGAKNLPIVMTYGNYMLNPKKDFYFHHSLGVSVSGEQAINKGKSGNFIGSRTVYIEVVTSKELKEKKISVTADKEKFYYDGTEKMPQTLRVFYGEEELTDKKGEAYEVICTNDNVNAGKVKYLVVGLYPYAGEVKKSFEILPLTAEPVVSVSENAVYKKTGAVPESVSVEINGKTLVLGQDYKIKYSNNKKASTEKKKAKYKITFIGNYKKTKAVTGEYTVTKASLEDAKIAVPDLVYGKKPGPYASAPYIEAGGILLKKSDYTVTYYDESNNIVDKKHPFTLTGDSAVITVVAEGKGNYSGTVKGTYKIAKSGDLYIDLKKAKITGTDGKSIPKQTYTGYGIKPSIVVQVKVDGKWEVIDKSKYTVSYIGNREKGKAMIVIKANDASGLIGSKTAAFTIVSKKL